MAMTNRLHIFALLFAFSLMFNPFYDVSSLSGFRPAALLVPAAFGAFLAWKKNSRGWFLVSLALMCSAQLNILFGIFCLGLALWWRDRKSFYGRSVIAMSTLWIAVSLIVAALVARFSGIDMPSDIGHFSAFGKSFDEMALPSCRAGYPSSGWLARASAAARRRSSFPLRRASATTSNA